MKKMLICLSVLVSLLACAFAGCQENPDNPGSSAGPETIDWDMTATFIHSVTGSQIATTLTVDGELPDSDGNFPLQMALGQETQWRIGHFSSPLIVLPQWAEAYPNLKHLTHACAFIYDSRNNIQKVCDYVFDLEKQMVLILICFDDTAHYIVASTDANIPPEDILAHFQGAIDVLSPKAS